MLPMFLLMTAPVWGLVVFLVLPLGAALPIYVAGSLLALWSHVLMRRASRQPVETGAEALVGSAATVVSWRGSEGTVRCRSELWAARSISAVPPEPGRSVRVVGVDHLTLEVEPEH